MLKDFLESKKCFKLVCGAGNEDIDEVLKLIKIYYQAGCRFFDLAMNEELFKKAKEIAPNAFFCISTGIKGDPHLNKAMINKQRCEKCGKCINICPQNAISNSFEIKKELCIGCLKCMSVCNNNAIDIYSINKNLDEVLPSVLKYKPDCIELHAIGEDEDDVDKKWKYISEVYDGIMSICIDRSKLGNERILARIKKLIKNRKPYTTIVQADGAPMSGGEDDYKTTLQAVAMAEIIQNAQLPVYILLSGGTNSKTLTLANQCEIDVNGVAIGSYARKIVKNKSFDKAVEIAKSLIIL